MAVTLADILTEYSKYGDSIYPLYKEEMHEPFMENENGIGYKGVVMYNEVEDKIQCSICSEWYQNITPHLKIHEKSLDDYKKECGLPKKVALCSMNLSKKHSETARDTNKRIVRKNFSVEKGKKWSKETNELRGASVKASKSSNWFKNKYGLCDAQIAARLMIVRDMCGKDSLDILRTGDIKKYDYKLYINLKDKYGTVKNAAKEMGLETYGYQRVEDTYLIAKLRNFVLKHKRMPTTTDMRICKDGLSTYSTYLSHFGSIRSTIVKAGLDQLLAEIK